jgi:hypothetical protein
MALFCGSGGFAVGFTALIVTDPEQFIRHDILPFFGHFHLSPLLSCGCVKGMLLEIIFIDT